MPRLPHPPTADWTEADRHALHHAPPSLTHPPMADWMSPTGTSASTPLASRAWISSAPKYMQVAANWAQGECRFVALSSDGSAAETGAWCLN